MIEPVFEFPDSLPGKGQAADSEEHGALVEAAREELRRRLPDLRKLPGCPPGQRRQHRRHVLPAVLHGVPQPIHR